MCKKNFIKLFTIISLITLIFIVYLIFNRGNIQITVLDGFSDSPLNGARVVIAETGEEFYTDKTGKTPIISVPIIPNIAHDLILFENTGTVTLLVYHNGYEPYALFYTNITNGFRNGPVIRLFPHGASGDEPFAVVEAPNKEWTKKILEKFDK